MHHAAQVNRHWRRVTLNRHGLWTTIAILALAHAPANTLATLAPGLGMAMTSLNPVGPVLLPDVSVTTGPCYLVGKPGMSRDAAPRAMLRQTADAAVQMSLTYRRDADSRETGTVELTACIARIRTCEHPGALKVGLRKGLVVSLQRPTAHAAPRSLSVTIREAFDWDPRNYSQQPGAFTHIHHPQLEQLRTLYSEIVELTNHEVPYKLLIDLQCLQSREL